MYTIRYLYKALIIFSAIVILGMSSFISCNSAFQDEVEAVPGDSCPVIDPKGAEMVKIPIVTDGEKKPIPLIDIDVPEVIETATFAMG